jgi:hypothetical protein
MERIRYITHHGAQVLRVDFTHCQAPESEAIVLAIPDFVTSKPLGSVLLLVDFTGAILSEEAIRGMQQIAIIDKPYVKRSAWIGTATLPDSLRREISDYSRREFPTFPTLVDALEWLTKD